MKFLHNGYTHVFKSIQSTSLFLFITGSKYFFSYTQLNSQQVECIFIYMTLTEHIIFKVHLRHVPISASISKRLNSLQIFFLVGNKIKYIFARTPKNYLKLSQNLDKIYVKLHNFLAVCAKMYLLLLPTRKNVCNELSLWEIEAEMGTCLIQCVLIYI